MKTLLRKNSKIYITYEKNIKTHLFFTFKWREFVHSLLRVEFNLCVLNTILNLPNRNAVNVAPFCLCETILKMSTNIWACLHLAPVNTKTRRVAKKY